MGMLKKAVVAAIASQVVQQARKPENQRRAKELIAQLRQRRSQRRH